jgi:hypothetical protein
VGELYYMILLMGVVYSMEPVGSLAECRALEVHDRDMLKAFSVPGAVTFPAPDGSRIRPEMFEFACVELKDGYPDHG